MEENLKTYRGLNTTCDKKELSIHLPEHWVKLIG